MLYALDSIKGWITKLKLPQNYTKPAQQHQAQPRLQHPSKGLDSSKLEHHLVQQRVRAGVESFGLEPMSSGAGPGRCRVDWARANVESSGPGPMSNNPGPSHCQVVRADVELFEPMPMLNRPGRGPMSSRLGSGRANVEPMSSRAGPS